MVETPVDSTHEGCSQCNFAETLCIGAILNLSFEDRIALYNQLKKASGLSNASIAKETGMSEMSMSRFFGGHTKDTKVSTLFDVLRVLLKKPLVSCTFSGVSRVSDENCIGCKKLQDIIEADKEKITYLREQIAFDEDQLMKKDIVIQEQTDFMHRKDRIISILIIALGVAVLLIMAALVVDLLYHDLGFFFRTSLSAVR